jgi:hypothetical protein
MPPERRRKFPSWQGLGVGNSVRGQFQPLLPTPNPSQEGNLAASLQKFYLRLTLMIKMKNEVSIICSLEIGCWLSFRRGAAVKA